MFNFRRTAVSIILAVPALFLVVTPLSLLAGVSNTKHNLAYWGASTVKSLDETQVCKFCHTPHNAEPAVPLWNHELPAGPFQMYSSATLVIDNPTVIGFSGYKSGLTGTSKLCMGCHDGVTGLAAIRVGTTIDMGVYANLGTRPSNYGTDLRNKHPVSFLYDKIDVKPRIDSVKPGIYGTPDLTDNDTIANADVEAKWKMEGNRVECNICHDPHDDKDGDPTKNPFWVTTSQGSWSAHDTVCVSCHSGTFGEYTGFGEYTSIP